MCYLWTPGTQHQRETAASKFKMQIRHYYSPVWNSSLASGFFCTGCTEMKWKAAPTEPTPLCVQQHLQRHPGAWFSPCSAISHSNLVRCYRGVLSANPRSKLLMLHLRYFIIVSISIFFFLSFKPGLLYVHMFITGRDAGWPAAKLVLNTRFKPVSRPF